MAGQAAGLHGGAGHAHHPVPHHLQEPPGPVQAVHVHQGPGRVFRGSFIALVHKNRFKKGLHGRNQSQDKGSIRFDALSKSGI